MSLLLDTSIIISLEKRDKGIIDALNELRKLYPGTPSISFMTYFEFIYGLHIKSPKNKEKSISFINLFNLVNPSRTTAVIMSDLKFKYDKLGKHFPLADYIIASQSIENGMILVTRDNHFKEIDELKKVIV